jgi:hypothetical protein
MATNMKGVTCSERNGTLSYYAGVEGVGVSIVARVTSA